MLPECYFTPSSLLENTCAMHSSFPRLLLLLSATLLRAADSTLPPGEAFAWGAGTGWMNLRANHTHGVLVGSHFLSGHAWSGHLGWISFGDGAPANGHSYSNTDGGDFGVNHDGQGRLSGLAWGAGIGWVNFGWAQANDPNAPRVDLLTGHFSGLAWSSSTGWIQLGTGQLRTATIFDADSDLDGISDAWEHQWFGTLAAANAASDADHDGASDWHEHHALTNPLQPSSKLRTLHHEPVSGGERLSVMFASQAGRLYRIQLSLDLLNWQDSDAGLIQPDPDASTTRLIRTLSPEKTFVRILPLKPLQP